MAQPYLDQLQQMVRDAKLGGFDLICNHFFSGAALYVEGSICASLTPRGLAFKLPESRCEELFAGKVAVPMQYFENSPVKRGYIVIPDIENFSDNDIRGFFEECVSNIARTDA